MIKKNSLGPKHRWLVPLALFAIAFAAGPLSQFHGLSRMPGNLIDSRLENYFLENIFQFLKGNSPSLVHLTYFYPFPYVLGFCDNLFGSAPAYLLPRLLTGQSDTAFQVWFLVGYAANYAAAYWALRRLSCSVISASVGALIFTFALPISGQTHHPQLQYRFGIPLAAAFLISFLEQKNWSHLICAIFLDNVIDHLPPTFVVEININIWHGDSIWIQKTLKKQVVFNGINIRYFGSISNH